MAERGETPDAGSGVVARGAVWRDRAVIALLVLLLAGVVLAGGQMTGTFALFTADTENQGSTFSGGWIPAPSSPSDSVTGAANSTISLGWTSGHSYTMPNGVANPVTAQQLQIADGGSGGSASCGTYANEGSQLGATATSTTDSGGSVAAADWWCYQMVSRSGTSGAGPWTSSVAFSAIRLFVPISVAYHNGGTAGKLDTNDTITITFNQNVGSAAGSAVCQFNTGTLLIGDSTCSTTADAYTVGKITGLTIGGGGHQKLNATVTVSGATVTVKITQNGQNETGAGTFTASTSITASSGGIGACSSSSGPNCSVAPSSSV